MAAGRHMLEDTRDEAALRRRHLQLVQAHISLRERYGEVVARNRRLVEDLEDEREMRHRAEDDLREANMRLSAMSAYLHEYKDSNERST